MPASENCWKLGIERVQACTR